MRKISTSSLVLAVVSVLVLHGCSTAKLAPVREEVQNNLRDAQFYASQVGKPIATSVASNGSGIERVTGLWLPARKATGDEGSAIAPALLRRITINQSFFTAQEIAERITLLSGIPVQLSPDVTAPVPGQTAMPGMAGQAGAMSGAQALPPLPGNMGTSNAMNSQYSLMNKIQISYDGSVAGLLDVVSARMGISSEYQNNQIRFFRYTTKTMRIVALPGDTNMQNMVSNSSGSQSGASGGGGGGTTLSSTGTQSSTSAQQAGVSFSGLSVWKGIEDSVKSMLSPAGKVIVTAATGTITVTDTPGIVSRVEKFIEQQNTSLGRQVIVNVRVLSVDLSDTDQYGINWDMVYNSLSGNFGWGFSNAFATNSAATNLTLKILGTAGSATAGDPNIKAWSGSKAIISALSTQGDVSQITSASITTLNNQPAPLQVGRQTSYLASSSTTATASVGNTTTITPGLITTGFSMNLVPHMLDKGKLLLQYAIDISSLVDMGTISSGGATIQTPEIDTRNFLQRVMLNSGDTLVMTGFEQTNLSATSQGMNHADNVMLGGGINKSKKRAVLVILIQPVISDI